ncbi:MAG: hypothetical protein Q4F00_01315 [bacterium]|nr:hypothetical protein [bacterium]
MTITCKKAFNLAVAFTVIALLSLACTQQPGNTPNAGNTLSNTNYAAPSSGSIPTRFENVTGVALYSVSAELKDQLALLADKTPLGSDRFFVLLNPKQPTEGILVRSPQAIDTTPESLSNHRLAITGNVITIDKTDSGLTECFVEKYGFSLAGDAQKRPIYIDAEIIDDPDAKKTAPQNNQQTPVPTAAETTAAEATAAPAESSPEASPSAEAASIPAEQIPAPQTESAGQENAAASVPAAAVPAEPATATSQTAVNEASSPAAVPVQEKSHSLNVTPMAPKAKESKPAEAVSSPAAAAPSTAEQPKAETAAKTAEAHQETAVPQDIAPTAQPLNAAPLPQDVAPTSQPLE